MDAVKGIADVVEHVLYETLGLLLPGAVLLLAVTAAWNPAAGANLIEVSGDHPWFALLAAYLAGYVVQGLSRAIVVTADALLSAPGRFVFWALPDRVGDWVRRLEGRVSASRHTHSQSADDNAEIDLETIAQEYWQRRLGVSGRRFSAAQLRDLAFSEILPVRKQLDRFRAATSFCRGCAAIAAMSAVAVAVQTARGAQPVSALSFAAVISAIVVFYSLMERADMYDRLWRSIVPVQFLCAASRVKQLPASDEPARATKEVKVSPAPLSALGQRQSTEAPTGRE